MNEFDVFPIENGDFPGSHLSFQDFQKFTGLPLFTDLFSSWCHLHLYQASYTGGDMRLEGSSPYCHLALGSGDLSRGPRGREVVQVIGGPMRKKRAPPVPLFSGYIL